MSDFCDRWTLLPNISLSLLPLLLLLLAAGSPICSQPTSTQLTKHESRNWTALSLQQDPNVLTNTVMLAQLKLLSLILEEIDRKNDQQSAKHLFPAKSISTVHPVSVLVQQHYGGTTFFNRFWEEFKYEFGDVTGNYWIGNERLHLLTREGRYKLRVELQAKINSQWYMAEYQTFRVWDESTQYRLEIGGYSGTAGDSMAYVNGAKFSTRDRDNDGWGDSCALQSDQGASGGFWYNSCGNAFVNSPLSGARGFEWFHLPVGSDHPDKKLLSSRFTLIMQ